MGFNREVGGNIEGESIRPNAARVSESSNRIHRKRRFETAFRVGAYKMADGYFVKSTFKEADTTNATDEVSLGVIECRGDTADIRKGKTKSKF